jgi:hypothetical protein
MIGGFLPSSCLATIAEYTYRHRKGWKEFLKYAFKMGSGAIIYIASYIKIGSSIQKLMGEGTQRDTAWSSHKPTFIFYT